MVLPSKLTEMFWTSVFARLAIWPATPSANAVREAAGTVGDRVIATDTVPQAWHARRLRRNAVQFGTQRAPSSLSMTLSDAEHCGPVVALMPEDEIIIIRIKGVRGATSNCKRQLAPHPMSMGTQVEHATRRVCRELSNAWKLVKIKPKSRKNTSPGDWGLARHRIHNERRGGRSDPSVVEAYQHAVAADVALPVLEAAEPLRQQQVRRRGRASVWHGVVALIKKPELPEESQACINRVPSMYASSRESGITSNRKHRSATNAHGLSRACHTACARGHSTVAVTAQSQHSHSTVTAHGY